MSSVLGGDPVLLRRGDQRCLSIAFGANPADLLQEGRPVRLLIGVHEGVGEGGKLTAPDQRDAEAVLLRLFAGPAGVDAIQGFLSDSSPYWPRHTYSSDFTEGLEIVGEAVLRHLRDTDRLDRLPVVHEVLGAWIAPFLLRSTGACIAFALKAGEAIQARNALFPGRYLPEQDKEDLWWYQPDRDESRALIAAQALLDAAVASDKPTRETLAWLAHHSFMLRWVELVAQGLLVSDEESVLVRHVYIERMRTGSKRFFSSIATSDL